MAENTNATNKNKKVKLVAESDAATISNTQPEPTVAEVFFTVPDTSPAPFSNKGSSIYDKNDNLIGRVNSNDYVSGRNNNNAYDNLQIFIKSPELGECLVGMLNKFSKYATTADEKNEVKKASELITKINKKEFHSNQYYAGKR